jgi:hypothetical protein
MNSLRINERRYSSPPPPPSPPSPSIPALCRKNCGQNEKFSRAAAPVIVRIRRLTNFGHPGRAISRLDFTIDNPPAREIRRRRREFIVQRRSPVASLRPRVQRGAARFPRLVRRASGGAIERASLGCGKPLIAGLRNNRRNYTPERQNGCSDASDFERGALCIPWRSLSPEGQIIRRIFIGTRSTDRIADHSSILIEITFPAGVFNARLIRNARSVSRSFATD